MSVSLVTVSYHSEDVIPRLLESLSEAGSIAETIVVNNDVEHPGLADRLPGNLTVVEADRNGGYGAGMNAGVAVADPGSEWLLLVNPDIVVERGAVDELVAAGSDPEIGVVGPQIVTPAGEVYPSARRLPSLRTGIGHAVFSRIWRGNPWTRAYLEDRSDVPLRREAGWLSGASLLVRRSAFEQVGGFDERFFMYFEDVDLCARLGRAGWKIVYDPAATVIHEGGTSTRTAKRPMIRAHHRSAYRFMAGKYRAWYLAPLRLALRVGLWVRSRIVSG